MRLFLKFILLIPLIIFSDQELNIDEISYGDHKKQKIDFYKGTSDKVLVWIHGGGWLYGDKRADRWIQRFQNHFVDHKKFNVFMIGYRIGDSTAPDAVNDVICAYKKIVEEALQRDLSTNDIVIAGASAGGHLALMIGLKRDKENKNCMLIRKPKAVINLFGITDIEETAKFLDETKFFKASNYVRRWIPAELTLKEASKKLSPIYYIDDNAPNVLSIHGTADRWVPYNQAILIANSLGNSHDLLTIDGGGHYFFSDTEDEQIRLKISEFLKNNYL